MFATPLLAAAYQSEHGVEHGRGQDKNMDQQYVNNPNYQLGLKHGQEDHGANRARQYRMHPKNEVDRRAYEWGYDQGYQGHGAYQGQYGNRPYGQNNTERVAYQNGFQEGLRYGEADRNNGHSNRPTYSSTYQKGTSGYNSSYGGETAYKNAFRQGYQAGYEQGYNRDYHR